MSDYLPLYRPGDTLTFGVTADVVGGTPVDLSGDWAVKPAAADSTTVVGIAGHDAGIGDKVITEGQSIDSDADIRNRYVEIGDHYADDMTKQAECRRKIWDASGFLLELVNEVLDMGKLESGEVVLEHRPFNMVKLLTGLQDVLEEQAAASRLQPCHGRKASTDGTVASQGHQGCQGMSCATAPQGIV